MGALPKPDYFESNETLYVEELREFFAMHGLRFGSSSDLQPFAEKLAQGGMFRDDMQSMVRSIIFREGGGIPRTELLRIVTTAVAGTDIDDLPQDGVAPVQAIMKFLHGVMRARWGMAEAEPEESREDVAGTVEAPIVMSVASEELSADSGAAETQLSAHAHPSPYSRARTMYQDPVTPDDRVREFPMPLSRGVSSAAEKQDDGVLFPWMKRPWAWGTALCVVLLSVLAMAWVRRSSPVPGPVSKATEPVVTPYYPPVSATTSAPAGRVAAAGAKSATSPQQVRGAHQDDRVQVAGTSAAYVGQDSHDGGPGMAAAAPTVAASAASAEADVSQPPAPIYRITPTTGFHPAKPAAGTPMEPTPVAVVKRSSRPPVYTPQGWLAVSPAVMSKNLISAPAPSYPALASMMHLEGKVVLRAVVDREGSVIETDVLQGHHLLRGAAKQAVERWRYRPYLLNGRPTEVATVVTVKFERK